MLLKESWTDEHELHDLKGCRIQVCQVPGRDGNGQAMVQIWPTKPPKEDSVNASDYDFDKKIGQQYFMWAPKTFKVDDPPPQGEKDEREVRGRKNHHRLGGRG